MGGIGGGREVHSGHYQPDRALGVGERLAVGGRPADGFRLRAEVGTFLRFALLARKPVSRYNFQDWEWLPGTLVATRSGSQETEAKMFGGLSLHELIPILILVLILFGARRLPELARNLGQGVREFRKSVKEISEDVESSEPSSPPPPKSS